ncbi:MAG: putative membrane protein [uncultured bacterium]|nr:MAG: putative membrane protein [uncultured bacterium]
MDNDVLILGTFFFVVNLTAFLIMLLDKNRSKEQGVERISEGFMFFLASAFGSFGVYAGMFSFHHKNRRWYFVIGIPLLMVQNCALLYFLYLNFAKYL